MTSGLRRAAIVGAGVMVGLAGVAGGALAATRPGWRTVYVSGSARANYLISVTAPSRDDAWAVGRYRDQMGQVILRWNGSRWRRARVPVAPRSFQPSYVVSTSPDDVWIFGYLTDSTSQEALIWDGARWRAITLPANVSPHAVISPSDAWLAGESGCNPTCVTYMYHWNGGSWTTTTWDVALVGLVSARGHAFALTFADLRGPGPSATGRPTLYEWTGGTWTRLGKPQPRARDAVIAASSPADIWMMADLAGPRRLRVLDHWNGHRWSRMTVPRRLFTNDGLTPDGHGGAWLGPYAHWTGRRWVDLQGDLPKYGGLANALAAVPGTGSVWLAAMTVRHRRLESAVAVNGGLP